jgi:nitroimidazol reductase NimA-like FMN-containing flavoprotein (pyridoxamine 5'-phosphate oxidase superfamily)
MPQTYGISAELGGTPPAWDQVSQALAAAHNYWIATARPDGRPHAIPVWGAWLEGMFYFSTDPASRKGRDLAANPWLVVHLESGDGVVILEGIAEEESDAAVLTRFADAYEAKYHWRPGTDTAHGLTYALRPRVAFTWRERDFPQSVTRWRFAED